MLPQTVARCSSDRYLTRTLMALIPSNAMAGILSVREFGAVLSEDEIQYP